MPAKRSGAATNLRLGAHQNQITSITNNPLVPKNIIRSKSAKPASKNEIVKKTSAPTNVFEVSPSQKESYAPKEILTTIKDYPAEKLPLTTMIESRASLPNNKLKDIVVSPEKQGDTSNKKLAEKLKIKPPRRKNQLAFTAVAGLESSSSRLNNFGGATSVYGFGFQYNLADKWIVRAALTAGKKVYSGKDGDYHPPSGNWATNIKFQNIEADCKVWEVPLSVGYKTGRIKKGTLYAILGTSFYFMKSEVYQFYFKNQNGNDTTRTARFTNKSNHYFTSLNASLIAEKKLSNNLSLQAEPYFKIPLSGIGFGKIRVYNIGLVASLKIKLL